MAKEKFPTGRFGQSRRRRETQGRQPLFTTNGLWGDAACKPWLSQNITPQNITQPDCNWAATPKPAASRSIHIHSKKLNQIHVGVLVPVLLNDVSAVPRLIRCVKQTRVCAECSMGRKDVRAADA